MSKHEVEKPVEHAAKPVEKPAAKSYTVGDLLALQTENTALKAKLAVYEPPAPDPVEYPKWIYERDKDGQITRQTLVTDAAAEAAFQKAK